jgi:mannose-6-phosphate isomerase-like protein (cupin superfamily)
VQPAKIFCANKTPDAGELDQSSVILVKRGDERSPDTDASMIIDRNSSEHYVWGADCEGWRLVDEKGLSVIEEEMPAHTSEKIHYHQYARQLFYILSGVARFENDGLEYVIRANQSFRTQPGQKHRIFNDSEAPLRFLVISQPTTRDDRIEDGVRHPEVAKRPKDLEL